MRWVLGIETSCDETSAAILRVDGSAPVLASVVILSQDVHQVFGGVVPELASRAHLRTIRPVVDRALADAGIDLQTLDAVTVTAGPGLVGALLVGVMYGKALALTLGCPFLGVNHLEGHLFAPTLEDPELAPPFVALLVSGGHTMLLDVPAWGEYRLLGRTLDDAAGEAYDKVATLLGLGYPGGPAIERLAREGDPARFNFPRPMIAEGFEFSFSGLKTAVLHAVRGAADLESEKAHIARGFQDALVESLVEKTVRAARAFERPRVVLGGGVACNGALVSAFAAASWGTTRAGARPSILLTAQTVVP